MSLQLGSIISKLVGRVNFFKTLLTFKHLRLIKEVNFKFIKKLKISFDYIYSISFMQSWQILQAKRAC